MKRLRYWLWVAGFTTRSDYQFLSGTVSALRRRITELESAAEARRRYEVTAHVESCIRLTNLEANFKRIALKLAMKDITEVPHDK